jgi:hypothetical protein
MTIETIGIISGATSILLFGELARRAVLGRHMERDFVAARPNQVLRQFRSGTESLGSLATFLWTRE